MSEKLEKKSLKEEEKTKADKIWENIKDMNLDLFALPGQKVSMHAKRIPIHDEFVHLKLSSQAVLAALESVLGSKYLVEPGEQYVVVKQSLPKA